MSSISNETLTIMLIAAGLAVIVLLVSVVALLLKVRKLSTPKFGFLGKPLYVGMFAVLAVGTIYIATNLNNQRINDITAGKDVRVNITTTVESKQEGYVIVKFLATPYVNNVEWGVSDTDTFDIYWSISGKDVYSKIQQGLSSSNTGTFSLELEEGTYDINLVMIYNTKTFEASKTVSF